MKKLMLLLSMVFLLLLVPVVAFCGDGNILTDSSGIEVYFVSLAALAAVVLPITEFIKRLLGTFGSWTVVLSWVVAIGLSFVGWWLNLGMFEGLKIIWVVIYGIAAGMVSNSVFDIGLVNLILRTLGLKIDKY